nr:hypothetical protein [Nitrosomonas nitrosa]
MNRMLRKIAALAAGSLCAAVLLSPYACTTIEHAQLALGRDDAEAARAAILESLEADAQPNWAGRYGWANGYERKYFDISATEFSYKYDHCTGIGELAYGKVDRVENGRIVLKPRFHRDLREPRADAADRRADFHFECELYTVPWGEETFLIPASLMPEFCALATAVGWNAMKYADYPRKFSGDYPVMYGAEDLSGLPDVPPEIGRFLPR